jgi:hypothetical protein
MATARSSTRGPAKPRGAKKPPAPPRERVAALDVLPVSEGDWEGPLPAPPPDEPECAFPREILKGRCPVAVFNSPGDTCSMGERVKVSSEQRAHPVKFVRGVMAVFSEGDAEGVRAASQNGRLYIEADPRFGAGPLMCSACYPHTRWYSAAAYQRHMKRHGNG